MKDYRTDRKQKANPYRETTYEYLQAWTENEDYKLEEKMRSIENEQETCVPDITKATCFKDTLEDCDTMCIVGPSNRVERVFSCGVSVYNVHSARQNAAMLQTLYGSDDLGILERAGGRHTTCVVSGGLAAGVVDPHWVRTRTARTAYLPRTQCVHPRKEEPQ